MPKETMNPRERWLAVLNREKPDRLPMDYWATPEVDQILMKYLGCNDRDTMLQKLHVDYVVRVRPEYVGPALPADTDVFGCHKTAIEHETGIYIETDFHPLATYKSVAEIEANYTWPNPDWWDYSGIPTQIAGKRHYPIEGGGSEPFMTYKDLRGGEQAIMDLIRNPDIVHYCLDKLFDLAYTETLRIYEQIPDQVLLSYIAEDMGAQQNLLYAPKHIHEFLLPRMKRIIQLAHEAGVYVFHHNDGAIRQILPDMIEAGIDILNPIQWQLNGMDREKLKQDFGDQVIFHGAVDNQYTLPFGSPDAVRQEVLDNIRILGEDGGYILAPCHNIQAVTSPENILVMYETGYEYGWF